MHIDWWTLALQTVNVLILIWLLSRYLFRPVSDIITRRQEEARKLIGDARAARADVEKAQGEADAARARIAAEQDKLLAEARKAAKAEYENILAQVGEDAAQARAKAEDAIAQDRKAAEGAIIERASAAAIDIARRLLRPVPPDVAMTVFLDRLCAEISALPAQDRAAFLGADKTGHGTEIVTPAALAAKQKTLVKQRIEKALGGAAALVFRADPSLIAGIELHARHAIIRNSWKHDLERIREELKRDDEQSGQPA